MKTLSHKRLCVFCGSVMGDDPAFAVAANDLGRAIAATGLDLVYGGGTRGLMGIVARATKNAGGRVIGVMPESLADIEFSFYDADEYYEVDNFHERKAMMCALSDAFVALPGGPGTLEELVEQIAWIENQRHRKPVFILNTNQYWDPFLELLKMFDSSLPSGNRSDCCIIETPELLIKHLCIRLENGTCRSF